MYHDPVHADRQQRRVRLGQPPGEREQHLEAPVERDRVQHQVIGCGRGQRIGRELAECLAVADPQPTDGPEAGAVLESAFPDGLIEAVPVPSLAASFPDGCEVELGRGHSRRSQPHRRVTHPPPAVRLAAVDRGPPGRVVHGGVEQVGRTAVA